MTNEAITAKHILTSLEKKYLHYQQGWALMQEVTLIDPIVHSAAKALASIPWREREAGLHKDLEAVAWGSAYYRRIDVLLMRTSTIASAKVVYERIAIEIKVSRGDFFRDTAEKRRVWQSMAHRFVYCTPAGLIKREELPEGCGLLELANIGGVPDWKVRAPRGTTEPDAFTDKFVAYMTARASRAESELRRLKAGARA